MGADRSITDTCHLFLPRWNEIIYTVLPLLIGYDLFNLRMNVGKDILRYNYKYLVFLAFNCRKYLAIDIYGLKDLAYTFGEVHLIRERFSFRNSSIFLYR